MDLPGFRAVFLGKSTILLLWAKGNRVVITKNCNKLPFGD